MATKPNLSVPAFLLLFMTLIGLIGVPGHPVSGQAPKTVLDYYLQLPNRYLFSGGDRAARMKLIKIQDVKNGYLRLEGDWEGFSEIALFRQPNGTPLIVVTNAECGPGCTQSTYFLEFRDGQWVNRQAELFPLTRQQVVAEYRKSGLKTIEDFGDDLPYLIMLPRAGRVIKVIVQPEFTETEQTIMAFELKDGVFQRVLRTK
ncbi:MAG TPA: hypothetical protein PKE58_18355 [Acidobacteriota bacterium]|nr:hypothetical protein [Acidobacteriota bacterium]